MVANRVSTCATQNLHIWPPLFSSGFSFRAHVIEKPPASAKEAHSCKFFLKQPTSRLRASLALRAKTLIHSLFPSPLVPFPCYWPSRPPRRRRRRRTYPCTRARRSPAHICSSSPPPLPPPSLPSCESAAFHHLRGGGGVTFGRTPARLSQGKYQMGEWEKEKKWIL